MDMVFPPVGKFGLDPELDVEQFSSFVYWRLPLVDRGLLEQWSIGSQKFEL